MVMMVVTLVIKSSICQRPLVHYLLNSICKIYSFQPVWKMVLCRQKCCLKGHFRWTSASATEGCLSKMFGHPRRYGVYPERKWYVLEANSFLKEQTPISKELSLEGSRKEVLIFCLPFKNTGKSTMWFVPLNQRFVLMTQIILSVVFQQ